MFKRTRNRTLALALAMLLAFGLMASASATSGSGKTVTVYLTRHGKTLFNTTGRMQGWSDTPLTDAGVEVAQDLGKGLSDIRFAAAYASDLDRAEQTANLVLAENASRIKPKLVTDEGLREICFGGYEGELNEKVWGPAMKDLGVTDMAKFDFMKGLDWLAEHDALHMAESGEVFAKRSFAAFDKLVKQTAERGGGNVLMVAHGITNGTIANIIQPGIMTGELENASVIVIEYADGAYEIKSYNDMSYVEAGRLK